MKMITHLIIFFFMSFFGGPALAFGQSDAPALFATLPSPPGKLGSYSIDAFGMVAFLGETPTSTQPSDIALSPDGRHLAVGHGAAGPTREVLRIFRVNPDASLTPVGAKFLGSFIATVLWLDNQHIALTEFEGGGVPDRVRVFRLDGGALVQTNLVNVGVTSRLMALSPDGLLLVVQDSGQVAPPMGPHTLHIFRVHPGGQLEPIDVVKTPSPGPGDLVFSPDGSRLYAVGGLDAGGIMGFRVNAGGVLTPMTGSPFPTPAGTQRFIVMTDDGAFLIGVNTNSDLATFAIGPNGSITPTGFQLNFNDPSAIGDVETLGSFFFLADRTNGAEGVRTFQLFPDGSFSEVGAVAHTPGVRPNRMALWPGAAPSADLNGDGVVNGADLAALLTQWGCLAPASCPADLNNDGAVNGADLAILLTNWGAV